MDDNKREEIKSIVRSEIRRALVEARESAKLTIESAAKLIGCEVDILLKHESGEIQPLTFIKILKVYGVPEIIAHEKLSEISFKISKLR
jgi:ribosome-binding protein aMBF1 (putative translation factor)